MIGSADIKNIPNQNGEFALKQKAVSNIIAETDLDGFASQRFLERCGFKKYRQEETV